MNEDLLRLALAIRHLQDLYKVLTPIRSPYYDELKEQEAAMETLIEKWEPPICCHEHINLMGFCVDCGKRAAINLDKSK